MMCIDETGNTYGHITVIKRAEIDDKGRASWLCFCNLCGNSFITQGRLLRKFGRVACLKCSRKLTGIKNRKISINDKFGMLTVLGLNEEKTESSGWLTYDCLCDCGNIKTILGTGLLHGTKTCGCIYSSFEYKKKHSATMRGISLDDWEEFAYEASSSRFRQSADYKNWRNSVYERDMWTCVNCGVKLSAETGLRAHHLNSYTDFPDDRLNVDNGATLCARCHDLKYPGSFHNTYWTHHNTAEQFEEWILTNTIKEQGA